MQGLSLKQILLHEMMGGGGNMVSSKEFVTNSATSKKKILDVYGEFFKI